MKNQFLELEIADKTYRVGRPGMNLQIAAQDRIKQIRDAEMRETLAASAKMPPQQMQIMVTLCFNASKQIVTNELVTTWLDSPAGGQFTFYHALLKQNPSIPEAEAGELYDQLTGKQLLDVSKFIMEGLLAGMELSTEETEAA